VITETTRRVRMLRQVMSSREIADAVKTSSSEQVRRWIRGDAQPSPERVEIINELFEQYINNEIKERYGNS
jgi:F0F1-type ATP synthase gamma subunit